jgi:2-deoxy-D-gluconate 3-dehydrogenase
MNLDAFKLDGKVALVTGAAQGIGQAISVGLAEAGAEVALLDRLAAEDTAKAVEGTGRRAYSIFEDLTELNSARAAAIVANCVQALGKLDILINNAGIIIRSPALEYSEDDWNAVLQVNLSGSFLFAQAAGRWFVEQGNGGKIVNVCSMLSFQGGLNAVAYTAAKSALAGLTRALANEWAPLGINVNAIAPGYLATKVTAGLRSDPERNKSVLGRIPAGRWGQPEDVKGAAVFLASAASDYIHGAILPVDGGWLSS